jgi:chromosome partitioning protein
MKRILVTNAKGGCGKTTIATNLASYFSEQGQSTALFDFDPQGSSIQWLRARPKSFSQIYGVAAYHTDTTSTRSWQLRIPTETETVIIDTPAGLRGHALVHQAKQADVILIPVTPSSIDIHATAEFLRDLLLVAKVRCNHTRVAIIANRVKAKTLALSSLNHFLRSIRIPVITYLRDSQNYLLAADHGIGLHELDSAKLRLESQSWEKIYRWIENVPVVEHAV